jgi:hypothetical protein
MQMARHSTFMVTLQQLNSINSKIFSLLNFPLKHRRPSQGGVALYFNLKINSLAVIFMMSCQYISLPAAFSNTLYPCIIHRGFLFWKNCFRNGSLQRKRYAEVDNGSVM